MMNKTNQPRATGLNVLAAALLALATSLTAYAPTASAGHGAAWGIGGLLAGGMLGKMYQQKHSQRAQYSAPPAAPPPPAASSPKALTPEQKIQQLNKLAAGGYITPQEYKTEKQAILNSIVD